jgi:hypothetical protein
MFAKCADAARRRQDDGDADKGRPPRPLWCRSYGLWNATCAAASGRWDLVNRRLMAAYRRDVLRRFDVARYLVFGQLLRYAPNPRRPGGASFHDGARGPAAANETDDDRSVEHEAIEQFER